MHAQRTARCEALALRGEEYHGGWTSEGEGGSIGCPPSDGALAEAEGDEKDDSRFEAMG
jgi:hypothetical protein